ncbi:hypothetical protein [Methanobacterium formicicum]|uniref:Uncharacterized protein n=1 Tax=Methanobacterium formicicum (strain DSM 3637 / PP1) TaxID=1204725 RepID=K2QWZ2_METFP|nr:hypothetical protein [Methanobacterium formicicum]EKF84783.1 hypothetical protein A994_12256 [Methanobacterium formicicum DSM 3637]
MELDDIIMKRLAFIKYLYQNAVEQSKKSAPMSSYSILTFHDAIELFLIFAYLYLDGNQDTRSINFMQYWDLISNLPNGVEISQKGSIKRLKNARVSLKHHGHLISDLDIEAHRATTTNFFEENTEVIFGIPFSDVSLINLIQYKEAKNNLIEARNLLQETNYEESILKATIAFNQVLDDYEDRKRDQYGRSPLSLGPNFTFMSGSRLFGHEMRDLSRYADTLNESIEKMREVLKIVMFNIDYRKYLKFNLITPHVVKRPNGEYWSRGLERSSNKEEAEFVINFVIESGISIQEFDFEISDPD